MNMHQFREASHILFAMPCHSLTESTGPESTPRGAYWKRPRDVGTRKVQEKAVSSHRNDFDSDPEDFDPEHDHVSGRGQPPSHVWHGARVN